MFNRTRQEWNDLGTAKAIIESHVETLRMKLNDVIINRLDLIEISFEESFEGFAALNLIDELEGMPGMSGASDDEILRLFKILKYENKI